MASYPEADGDWFGYPQFEAPSYLTPLGQRLFKSIEVELLEQGKKATLVNSGHSGDGYVVFRKDKVPFVLLDCEINLAKLVERLERVIKEYEDTDAGADQLVLPGIGID